MFNCDESKLSPKGNGSFLYLLQYMENGNLPAFTCVMDRDTNDVSLIRFVNRLSIPAGHSPIF